MNVEYKEIGKLYKIGNEIQFEWRIIDLFSTAKMYTHYRSPAFLVAGASWILTFWYADHNYIGFRLASKKAREYSVEYSFLLKALYGSVDQFASGIMQGNQLFSESHGLDYPSKDITIMCVLKCQMTCSTEPTVLDQTKPLTLISPEKLSEKLKILLNDKETCDTTLVVKDKECKAHRAILIAHSPVFAAMFKHDTAERQTGVVNIPDCDPDSFQEFLECLYCGKLEKISLPSVFHLYVTSDKYEVQELKAFCVEYLKQCLTIENIFEIVVFADKYDETELFSAIQSFFKENMKKILQTSEWECFLKSDFRLANKLLIEIANVKP